MENKRRKMNRNGEGERKATEKLRCIKKRGKADDKMKKA